MDGSKKDKNSRSRGNRGALGESEATSVTSDATSPRGGARGIGSNWGFAPDPVLAGIEPTRNPHVEATDMIEKPSKGGGGSGGILASIGSAIEQIPESGAIPALIPGFPKVAYNWASNLGDFVRGEDDAAGSGEGAVDNAASSTDMPAGAPERGREGALALSGTPGALSFDRLSEAARMPPMARAVVQGPVDASDVQADDDGAVSRRARDDAPLSFWDKTRRALDDPRMSAGLLKFGAGVLSGRGFVDGLSKGFAAMGDELAQKGSTFRGYSKYVGPVRLPDGRIVSGEWNPEQGLIYRNDSGEFIPANGGVPVTAGSISGLSSSQSIKEREAIQTEVGGLRELQRVMAGYDDINSGFRRLADKLSANVKTFFGMYDELTPEEILLGVQNGRLQGLIGLIRESVVGPGVMTEQDAIRVLARVGGDLSALQNPEVAKKAISEVMEEKIRRLKPRIQEWNRIRAPGFEPIEMPDIEFDFKSATGGDKKASERESNAPDNSSESQDFGIKVGHVEDGYRYIGGDPSKPESWEKVKK